MTRWLWLVLVVSCTQQPTRSDKAVAAAPTEAALHDAGPVIAMQPSRPAPPPPPPPPAPTSQPPPAAVTAFLAAHASDATPWTARARGRPLSADDAAELARRLGIDASYVNGDYGCVGNPVKLELARGAARLAFIEDCGHMQIGDDSHAGLFSKEMIEFLQGVEGRR